MDEITEEAIEKWKWERERKRELRTHRTQRELRASLCSNSLAYIIWKAQGKIKMGAPSSKFMLYNLFYEVALV